MIRVSVKTRKGRPGAVASVIFSEKPYWSAPCGRLGATFWVTSPCQNSRGGSCSGRRRNASRLSRCDAIAMPASAPSASLDSTTGDADVEDGPTAMLGDGGGGATASYGLPGGW